VCLQDWNSKNHLAVLSDFDFNINYIVLNQSGSGSMCRLNLVNNLHLLQLKPWQFVKNPSLYDSQEFCSIIDSNKLLIVKEFSSKPLLNLKFEDLQNNAIQISV